MGVTCGFLHAAENAPADGKRIWPKKEKKPYQAPVTCEVCNVSMHPNLFKAHKQSKRHLRKLYCKACDFHANSLAQLKHHKTLPSCAAAVEALKVRLAEKSRNEAKTGGDTMGKKRKAADGSQQEDHIKRVKGIFSCAVCGIADFTSQAQLDAHLRGKKHAAQVAKLEAEATA